MRRFKKAERKQARLRLALTGPSGAGKTYSALLVAGGIGGKIAVIDTERGSASLYAGLPGIPEFETLELDAPFTPESYIEAIHDAEKDGFDILIIDSMTHEWNGKGGVLEIHDTVTRTKCKGNSYTAWGEVTPRHNAFVDAILQARMHMICTMRSKSDFVLEEKNGKQVPKKVGLAPIQRDGLEYEFTVVLDIDKDGNFAFASKDRTRLFPDPIKLSADDGARLNDWLLSGKAVEEPAHEQNRLQQQQPPTQQQTGQTSQPTERDISQLTGLLMNAARKGSAQFSAAWDQNAGPARKAIFANKEQMEKFKKASADADKAEGNDINKQAAGSSA